MAEQEKGEAAPEGQDAEGERPPERPEPEATKPAARPAKRAEAATSEREAPPPGSIAGVFAEVLPEVQQEAYQGMSNVVIEIGGDDVAQAMRAAKDDPRLDFNFLRCLFGVDHSDEGMEVVYQLLSLEKGHEVTIRAKLPQGNLQVASVTSVWKGANWHERETRDMFGITFDGHPHLVPLLLPEDMTDHFPLRKDSPLAEIEVWQGERLEEGAEGGAQEKRK